MTSFVRRKIDLTFRLGTGSFGGSGADTVTVSGLRAQCQISEFGGDSMGQAQLRVYGLTPSMLNQLSALNDGSMFLRNNSVAIAAGDDASGMATIFDGQITLGVLDLNGAPETALVIIAQAGLLEAVKPADPRSYPGSADAADIMAGIAAEMGLAFENNGVSVKLATPYYAGSLREQARRCAEDAHIRWLISNGTLAIWPWGGSRAGTPPLISPETGMIGYPSFSTSMVGITVHSLFNPTLNLGQIVQVRSGLGVANGNWIVTALAHDIESETPGGHWMTSFQGIAAQ